MGIPVHALSHGRGSLLQTQVAAGPAEGLPGAAGSCFRAAQDGVVRFQIDGEAAVAAAEKPVAVHLFTLRTAVRAVGAGIPPYGLPRGGLPEACVGP